MLAVGAAALAAVAVAGSGAPAAAVPGAAVASVPAAGAEPTVAEEPDGPLTAPDGVSAGTIARLTGEPVEIVGERSETGSVFALPDGSRAAGLASGPVWVRRGGDGSREEDWAALDLTLGFAPDGSVRAAAHPGDLALSGGGTSLVSNAVAWLTDAEGAVTTLSWAGVLPRPELSGPRAVYRGVRPGVDLVVEATASGFEQFFVVHERPVAGESVSFPLTLSRDGGQLSATEQGTGEAAGSQGAVVGSSEPLMWAAAADAGRAHPVSEPWVGGPVEVAPYPPMPDWSAASSDESARRAAPAVAGPSADEDPAAGPASGLAVSGQVEVEQDLVQVDGSTVGLTLRPAADWLADPGTVFPVVVDPEVDLGVGFDTWVLKGYTDDRSASTELAIGTYDGGAHVARSFLTFRVTDLKYKDIQAASLSLYEFHSWSCDARDWQVWSTGGTDAATRWTSQPAWGTLHATTSATRGYGTGCADGRVEAPVASLVQGWSSAGSNYGYVGLRAASETDNFGWKRFYSANAASGVPYLWVKYNSRPDVAGVPVISPKGSSVDSVTWTSTSTPQVSSVISDADGGQVQATFQVRAGETVVDQANVWAPSGTAAKYTLPAGKLTPGVVYGVRVATYDGTAWNGTWSTEVKFAVDATAPLAPLVASGTYPSDGTWHGDGGVAGTFTFTLPGADASVIAYRWGLNKAPDPAQQVAVVAGAAGSAQVTPAAAGEHVLQVAAVDRAGNVSGVASYRFLVGRAGILAPTEGARVVSRARVELGISDPSLTHVKFQWRRGPDSTVITDVAAGALSTSTGVGFAEGFNPVPAAGGYSAWDAAMTLGYAGGPVQLRAVLATSAAGAGPVNTQWVTVTLDPDADGAATTGVGPGSVNLLTGDHYLSATDVEEFGLALTRTASSRDTDAGYQPQPDRLTVTQRDGSKVVAGEFVTPSASIASVTDRYHDGGSSFKITPTGTSNATYVAVGGDTGGLRLGLVPGATYRLSAWVYVPAATGLAGGNPAAASMALVTRTGTGAYSDPVATGQLTAPPSAVDTWQQRSVDVTVPSGASEAMIRLYNGQVGGSGKVVYFDDLSVRRLWAPMGPQWALGAVDSAAGTAYTKITMPYDDVAAIGLVGGGEIWFATGNGSTWWPAPGAEDLTLTRKSTDGWRLTEIDGTITDFTRTAGTKGDFLVASSAPPAAPGASRYVYAESGGVQRLTRIIAPIEPGVDGWVDGRTGNLSACTGATPAIGCEVLELVYAATTTATASVPGDFAGQVSSVRAWSYDPQALAVSAVPVAAYRYDTSGRLVEVQDPRIVAAGAPALTTTYTYDTAGRVASLTESGEPAYTFEYGTAGGQVTGSGDWIDPSAGRLVAVSRPSLVPGTTDQLGPVNTTRLVYDVPLTRAEGGPYDLGPGDLATWGQVDGPTDATAVFDPRHDPGASTASASLPGAGGYAPAQVYYLNASGLQVNAAAPAGADTPVQGYIDTAEYDRTGKTIRTLDATNRLLALGVLPDAAASLAAWGLADRSSTELAGLLDSRSVYSADGLELISATGPVQMLAVGNDPDQQRLLRPNTQYVYDEGKPDGASYHLATTITSAGLDPLTGELLDPVVTRNTYDPIDGAPVLGGSSGWVHSGPTTVTVDADGPAPLTSSVIYDQGGRVIESRKPGSNGTDAGTTRSVYYTAAANPTDPSCGATPAWAGQPCLTRTAGEVTGGDPTRMSSQLPVRQVLGYNRYGTPTVVTESVTGPLAGSQVTQTRTTTTTYDAADRVTTVTIEGTGAGIGQPVATTRTVYDPVSGEVAEIQSLAGDGSLASRIVKAYDVLGRLVSYTDAHGASTTTTFDRYGNPATETQTLGAQPIGTRTFTYDQDLEPRGFLTSISDSVAGTIEATWGPDGQLQTQALPGGVTLTIGYDPARVPVTRTYTRASDGQVIFTDTVVENHRGQVVTHASSTGTARYGYDRFGRLTSAQDTVTATGVCQVRTYDYDEHTNRISATSATGAAGQPCPSEPDATTVSTYDSADRLVSGFGGDGWVYDPLGRITSMPGTDATGAVSNEFYVNDLVAAQQIPAQARMTWGLDPIGRRSVHSEYAWVNDAWAASVSKVSHYATDSDEPAWIAEDTTLPNDVTRYVSGVEGDLAISTSLTGDRELQLVDLHGDVAATLPIGDDAPDADWGGLRMQRADEFGNPVNMTGSGSTTGPPARYGWLGAAQRSSEALGGVVLMGVRLYHPATGRFLSVDPVEGGSATDYDYCSADPVNCTDLAGTFSFGSLLKVVTVVASVASVIPGPVGAAAAGIAAVGYIAQGNTAMALTMGAVAAANLVGAGNIVRVAATGFSRAAAIARSAGQAAGRALPRLQRAATAVTSALRDAKHAVTIVAKARSARGFAPGIGREMVVSERAANWAGRLWTLGGRVTSSGGRITANGLRQYRPPAFKPQLGYRQANFESRATTVKGTGWPNNLHVRIS